MDWASNIFIVLLITDITGTIFFLVGEPIRKRFDNDVVILRFLTKATIFAYLVPFIYIILYLGKRISIIKIESDINLFYGTPLTLMLTAVLGWIWIGLFLSLLTYRLYRVLSLIQTCRGNIPEEDENVFRVFTDICAELGVEGKVSLCRNDSVNMPCITYYHGFVVILPLFKYTEKEAEVIFYHELCHYLNGDLYFKPIGYIATQLHVFNPAIHKVVDRIDILCERYCDIVASKKGKNRFTQQEYFQVIMDFLTDDGTKRERYSLFALADDKSDYERRVMYMNNLHVKGGMKKGAVIALAACFLLGSSITSLAAGDGVAEAYEGLTDATKVQSDMVEYDELGKIDESIEMLTRVYDLDPEDVIIMEDDIMPYSDGEPWHITWTIPAGKTYVSSGFRVYEDDKVTAVVYGTPDDLEFETGIKDPDAIMWYKLGSDMVAFQFLVQQTGRHYFYVTNLSETEKLHIEAYIFL